MVINTYIIYESLEGLLCYNNIGGVGIPVSLRHNGLSVVRIRGSSVPFFNHQVRLLHLSKRSETLRL
jgi:hypothetical protein